MSFVEKPLRELLKAVQDATSKGNQNQTVTGIALDSRKVRPGDLYVCIPGFKTDGHNYAEKAVAAGAAALVVERFLPFDVPQLKVVNSRQAVGYIAAELFDYPSRKMKLIGVTGTNGKTTVTHLVEKIAAQSGMKTGLIGTLGTTIDGKNISGQHTTPESVDIQRLLAEMTGSGVDFCVMEVSSHALDLGRVNGCEYKAGIFTNLSQDHLDFHEDMTDYLRAKSLLFRDHYQEGKFISVLNADDCSYPYLKDRATNPVSYGIEASEAEYRAQNIVLSAQGVQFDVCYQGKREPIIYNTPGRFSVYNALAAFAWAVESGYDPKIIKKALLAIKGVPGRFESIRKGQEFQVIVDYAHTPDGLENVLSTAREFTAGKLITVFGCGGDRDKTKRPLMGKTAAHWSDYVVVTSDNPRTEEPERIIEDILPGVTKVDYKVIADRREAICHACAKAKNGDTIVIAGKGHEDYQILGSTVIHFDDKEEVEKAIRGLGYVE